jgi:geranylgeranyl pyrophosphate synthase
VIAALEKADDADRKTIEQMLRVWNPQRQAELLGFLHSYGSHHECSRVIRELSELARQALAPLAASEGLDALLALASFLAQQTEALGVGI